MWRCARWRRRRSRWRRTDGASAQSALARVRASGEMRIGTDATYPPFASAQGGEFAGFDIDLGTRDRARAGRQAGLHQRQLRRHLPGAAERQLRHRALGRDDHAGAARHAAVLGSLHRRRSAAGRAQGPAGHQRPGRSRRQARRRADQHHRRSSTWKSGRRDDVQVQHDRPGAPRSAERTGRRGRERRPGASLHDAGQLPGPEDRSATSSRTRNSASSWRRAATTCGGR